MLNDALWRFDKFRFQAKDFRRAALFLWRQHVHWPRTHKSWINYSQSGHRSPRYRVLCWALFGAKSGVGGNVHSNSQESASSTLPRRNRHAGSEFQLNSVSQARVPWATSNVFQTSSPKGPDTSSKVARGISFRGISNFRTAGTSTCRPISRGRWSECRCAGVCARALREVALKQIRGVARASITRA